MNDNELTPKEKAIERQLDKYGMDTFCELYNDNYYDVPVFNLVSRFHAAIMQILGTHNIRKSLSIEREKELISWSLKLESIMDQYSKETEE